ncbi:hypothetical protein N7528_000717 [Penicillium herquei]|nr:hypothetical protein N7528_000717 [Penicillium herquei]
MAAPTRSARPKPVDWPTPPHLTIFVRNIKLLCLDQREDWPDITLRSLSPSSTNQRQRIRLIEWALYYLFATLDPEGTQNKLRPFFPPLEPLQSVNLRAAFFRALSELKKNGDLGRETILRKTMLDDCKGEKFDELLAVFSTTVLRKLLAASVPGTQWSAAMKLSAATSISPGDYQNMLPLILAHQVSLGTTGARHARVHEAYDQFSQLLDRKKVELAEQAKRDLTQDLSQMQLEPEALARELRANWLGSEEWAAALVEGGAQSSTDSFLELPFSRAWALAADSSVDKLRGGSKQDLVVDLEARVLRLRTRVRKWHEFNESLRKERDANGAATGPASKEPRLLFRDHQALTVASISKAVRQPTDRGRTMNSVDRSFVSNVNEAIARINGKPRNGFGRGASAYSMEFDTSSSSSKQWSNYQSTAPRSPDKTKTSLSRTNSEPIEQSPEPESIQASPLIVRLSPDQSPISEDEPTFEPMKMKSSASSYTLVERTRRSMSLIPPLPAHEAPPQHRLRRGPRTSFPVNQFETPRKSSRGRSGASTPQDKLFEDGAEYNSVFKSRPRVANSPISSPAVHASPSFDEDEFDLDQSGAEWGDVDSPLTTSRYR